MRPRNKVRRRESQRRSGKREETVLGFWRWQGAADSWSRGVMKMRAFHHCCSQGRENIFCRTSCRVTPRYHICDPDETDNGAEAASNSVKQSLKSQSRGHCVARVSCRGCLTENQFTTSMNWTKNRLGGNPACLRLTPFIIVLGEWTS